MAEPQESRMLLRAPSPTYSSRFHHALWYHHPLELAARLRLALEMWLMPRWSRSEQAAKRLAGDLSGLSERRQAEHVGVARTTLQYWRQRQAAIQAPAAEVAFFETAEGIALLHRLLIGAHFVITLLGCGGVRLVCQFLELTGLGAYIAASYGVQQGVNVALEQAVVHYAEEQRRQLGEGMAPRTITVCEDETFHPEICLVGLEPVSNFIVLERYAESRSAERWTAALAAALSGLPVEVIQATSDEAKGLRRHVQTDLGAHHAPDLFHLQHDVAKATGLPLARQVKAAEQALADAQGHLDQEYQARTAYESHRPPGRPPAFEQRLAQAYQQVAVAECDLHQAHAHQTQAQEVLHELSAAYHPYDLDTGQIQPTERVAERLQRCWQTLQQLARAANLPERCQEQLRKAQRLTGSLLATISFFFATIQANIEVLNLPPEVETAAYQALIPAIYLERVADKTAEADQRSIVRQRAANLLAPLNQPGSAVASRPDEERRLLEQVAIDCADVFQRSSSCVEGRNGQLALHHHARHRLSDRKLSALTAVHNYFIQRPDGATAAQRFFGRPPAKLFEWVLKKTSLPGRPAHKRPRPAKPPYLQPIAA
jgi:hypothetical protein